MDVYALYANGKKVKIGCIYGHPISTMCHAMLEFNQEHLMKKTEKWGDILAVTIFDKRKFITAFRVERNEEQ